VLPVIRRLSQRLEVPLSIDTSKAEVARQALEAGASLVNDVTALRGDPAMAGVVARARVPVILMYMRGTPQTMQRRPRYHDVVREVLQELREATRRATRAGIAPSRIFIDPGLGFGKTLAHNLALLQQVRRFASIAPVVIGPSRKSFIGQVLGVPVHDRLAGTLACVLAAASQGAAMVRVHDVKPTVQALTMWQRVQCG
jgi:dihydropteroate synthase